MVSVASNRLYEGIVEVTRDYLGPAADRFIARQIVSHLQKQPEELTRDDMRKLINWLKLSMAFLTNDEKLIDQYVEQLQEIASSGSRTKTSGRASNPSGSIG